MERIKNFVTKAPITFGFVVTLLFIVLVIISAVFANRWPAESSGWYLAAATGRIVSSILLLALVAGLGWLHSAGFTRPGRRQTWLLLLLPLVYSIAVSAFAMTGNLNFGVTDSALTAVVALFIMTAALMEEIAFRGLIMHGFVRSWGSTGRGLTMSVLVSALFFGLMHMVNVLGGQPLTEVLWQCGVAFSLGIFLGALVISGKSIYPAVFFHGILNLAGYLNLTSNDVEGTFNSWLLLCVLMIPLAVYGLYLIRSAPQRTLAIV